MKTTSKYFFYAMLLTVLFLLTQGIACKKDDINDDNSENVYSYCKETVTVLGSSSEQSSIAGLPSADSLLSWAGDGFTINAGWSVETDFLTQSPLGGETILTVSITYDGGEIREINLEHIQGINEIAMDCQPRLEVEVKITVITQDGAFNETMDAILSKSVSYQTDDEIPLMLYAEFDPAQLNGNFEIVSVSGTEPDWIKGELNCILGDLVKGEIRILVQQSDGDGNDGTVSFFTHTALSWEQ